MIDLANKKSNDKRVKASSTAHSLSYKVTSLSEFIRNEVKLHYNAYT